MFSSARSLRGYGFGDSGSGAYPLVAGVSPASVYGGNPSLKQRDISFDTSSKEPHLLRCRVFVGNMNTNLITREDIIRLFSAYGTLYGVTVFKGYAFIQFGSAAEADMSVTALNRYSWNGSILDVKLAIAGMKAHNVSSTVSPSKGVKRVADNWSNSNNTTITPKKQHMEDAGNFTAQNERNRKAAAAEESDAPANLYETGMPDTLICGNCRYVTSDFVEFRDHRKKSCTAVETGAAVSHEWQCSMCDEMCMSGATLIEHALERHSISLLKQSTE